MGYFIEVLKKRERLKGKTSLSNIANSLRSPRDLKVKHMVLTLPTLLSLKLILNSKDSCSL